MFFWSCCVFQNDCPQTATMYCSSAYVDGFPFTFNVWFPFSWRCCETILKGPNSRTNGCDAASLLVHFDEHWPFLSTVVVYYYVRDGPRISHDSHLVTASVQRWLQHEFNLSPQPGAHEVCAQVTALVRASVTTISLLVLTKHMDAKRT
ncbi:unnamed protein product [Heligmosomoides polygyrus]|uniref:Neur_chan_LBD domain-containing protein n=1 Tax=Heligmosomoides polygyrus TaxID=6339 RepID=A0A183GJ86_HELPZ|nr:unnamed protein product [Heligmosomoides polygyrus]